MMLYIIFLLNKDSKLSDPLFYHEKEDIGLKGMILICGN